jgi:signal transduction histidine kinase
VASALRSAGYLNELVGNILDLTALEAGRMSLEPRDLDLRAEAGAAADILAPKAAEYGVRLDVSGVPEGARVLADAQGLRRVLVNLISNGLKFTPQGGTVSVRWTGGDAEDRVAVADTGIGIPAERIPGLFKKFAQVPENKDKVRAAPGTGLGLVICKELVQAHGGRIWVESPGRDGSVFTFTLPKKKEARSPAPPLSA